MAEVDPDVVLVGRGGGIEAAVTVDPHQGATRPGVVDDQVGGHLLEGSGDLADEGPGRLADVQLVPLPVGEEPLPVVVSGEIAEEREQPGGEVAGLHGGEATYRRRPVPGGRPPPPIGARVECRHGPAA